MNTDKLMSAIGRISSYKAVTAIKEGMGMSYGLIMLGSIMLLIARFPLPHWDAFWTGLLGAGWSAAFLAIADLVFGLFAIWTVLGVAYKYCEAGGVNAVYGAFLSLVVFLLLVSGLQQRAQDLATNPYLGFSGILTAIFTALAVSAVLSLFHQKGFRLPSPAGVPDGVISAFSELVPGLFILFAAILATAICTLTFKMSLPALIQIVIQAPIQYILDTFAGGFILSAAPAALFWAGLHGPAIFGAFFDPFLTANTLENQQMIDCGNLGGLHIMSQQMGVFTTMGGCGLTLGLVLAILLTAKSEQLRSVGRTAGIPGLFNINEPLIFGLPIVFNPYFLIPFILAPAVGFVITWTAISTGFMPAFSAVQVLWPTPPVISGFLLCGWQGSVVQFLCIIASTLIYLPFVRKQDEVYRKEQED